MSRRLKSSLQLIVHQVCIHHRQTNQSSASTMSVAPKVTKKSSHEHFPSTAKYSDRSRSDDASHTVSLDTEFRAISNPDEVVAPEDRVKAYKVGTPHNVPLPY